MEQEYPKVYLYKRIVQAKLFIDENYSMQIDLNNISDEAYFSKFHFIRLFKNIYGKTPHQYLTQIRIAKAAELLRMNTSVTQTCYGVGFHSLTSFTSLFKKYSGSTPSSYLFKHQQHLLEVSEKPLTFIPGCFAESKGWIKK